MTTKELVYGVREIMGEGYEIKTQKVVKPNGDSYTGITIKKVGSNEPVPSFNVANATPQSIVDGYNNLATLNINMLDITSKDYILENVFPVLYNKEINEDLLRDVVYVSCADLAMAFRVRIDSDSTYLVKNNMPGIIKEELYDAAIKNIQGKAVTSFWEVFTIVSNRSGYLGAAMIFDKEIEFPKEFYIIPSSVHEVLIIDKTMVEDISYIKNMIREVNNTAVRKSDFLSDHLYAFKNKRLEVIA